MIDSRQPSVGKQLLAFPDAGFHRVDRAAGDSKALVGWLALAADYVGGLRAKTRSGARLISRARLAARVGLIP